MTLEEEIIKAREGTEEVLGLIEDSVKRKDRASFNDLKYPFYRVFMTYQELLFTGSRVITDEDIKQIELFCSKYSKLRRDIHV
jgi:hypothetical protein